MRRPRTARGSANAPALGASASESPSGSGWDDALYRSTFEDAPVGLFRSTPNGRILAANATLVRLLGYEDRRSVLARPAAQSWADPGKRAELVRRLAEDGEVSNFDALWRRRDGSTFWARLTVQVVPGPDGGPPHYEGQVQDVTDLKQAEQALRESELRYRQLAEEVPAVLYLAEAGREGRWLYVGPRIEDLLGFTQDEWQANPELWARCLHPDDAERVLEAEESLWSAFDAGTRPADEPILQEYRMIARDGREVDVRDEAAVVPRPVGGPLLRGMLIDITERKRAERALDLATKRATSVIEASLDAIVVMDHRGTVVDFNPAAEQIFGYRREEIVGLPMASYLIPGELRDRHREAVDRFLRTREKRIMDRRLELEGMRRDGALFPAELTITTVRDSDPPVFIGYIRDISERKRAQALLEKRAEELERSYQAVETLSKTDPLTGLPNRQALMEHLDQVLTRGGSLPVAVFVVDVDRFKGINDLLGHDAGDAVLLEVGRRIREATSEGDMLARLGGDEFGLVREGLTGDGDARELARRVAEAVAGSFAVADRELDASASVGVTVARDPSRKVTELLREADAAVRDAKQRGLGSWGMFDTEVAPRSLDGDGLLTSLRRAPMEEFEVHYQPVVDLRSDRITGYEALVRWRHPARGLVPPGMFLELAEDTGLILQIGDHVLGRACEDAVRLLEPLGPGGTVAVNLSARQLAERTLPDRVLEHIQRSGLQAHQLCVEITETASLSNADVAVDSLRRLRAAGVRVAVDDFGIGYSSLLYLRMFPIDLVKIDRTFVQGTGRHAEDTAIVSAVTNMARSLGLVPVAEGVETSVQRDAVRRAGCQLAQGFLWSRAVPYSDALALARSA
jgi:diguanylate cyclase (GGDEF)-like protein/PAS domain S-box-containing protein